MAKKTPDRAWFMAEKRKEIGLSQQELAQRVLRVSLSTVKRWEKGTTPVPHAVDLIMELLGSALTISRGPDGKINGLWNEAAFNRLDRPKET